MRINMLESLTDNIVIDKDKCTFCGVCVETCILDNLRMKLSPCRQACPLKVNCHGYVQLIARGEEEKGLELLRESLPFPGILGRICSQPCENKCYRKEMDGEAVSVNGQRIIANAAISSVGTNILINNVHTAPPFEIDAVGDTELLVQRMLDRISLADLYEKSLKARIVLEISLRESLVIPVYSGELKTDYLNLIDEE